MGLTRKQIKNIFTILISAGLAAFFMWLALGDLDFDKVKASFAEINYFWAFVSAFFAVLAYWFRAVRWNLLLEPMGYQIRNSNAFWTIAFGYMMNLTIPRSGEIARATTLFRIEKVPVEKSIATIVIERLVDLVFMLLFLLLTFIFNGKVLASFYNLLTTRKVSEKKELTSTDSFLLNHGVDDLDAFYFNLKIALVVLVLLGSVVFVIKFKEKIISFIKGLIEGFLAVRKIKNKLAFVLHSAGIWICYFLAAYLVCFALKETSDFTIGDGFLLVTAGTLGMMVPTSGGAGSYHIVVKIAIVGIFISLGKSHSQGEEVGISYALISHLIQTIATLVFGLISIFALFGKKNDK